MKWKRLLLTISKEVQGSSSAGKGMASVFRDAEGIVFIECLHKRQIINGEKFVNLLRQLRKANKTKRQGKLRKSVLFHGDNALAHRSLISMTVVRDCDFEPVNHSPYAPNLATSDYHLYPHMKNDG